MLDGVYLLVTGAVSMQLVRQAEVAEIAAVGPGELFGEAGMHGAQTADSRAVAVEDTEVLLLGPDTVRLLFEASPRWLATLAGCSTSGAGHCNRRARRCGATETTASARRSRPIRRSAPCQRHSDLRVRRPVPTRSSRTAGRCAYR